jgi:hypothetical protein
MTVEGEGPMWDITRAIYLGFILVNFEQIVDKPLDQHASSTGRYSI